MRPLSLLLLVTTAVAGPGPKDGSAFDLSMPFPEPGKLGRLIADGPNLRFQNDPKGTKRILIGTNLTGTACFPTTDKSAEAWAEDLHRRGYNAIRFHHIDWVIRDFGWGYKIHADRFLAALRKRGIHVTIDLYSSGTKDREGFKRGVITGNLATRSNWKSYAERLLTEPSQIEGVKPWKDEPTIFGICPLNEDDPRFLGVPSSKYDAAYRWMLKVVRDTGFDGLVWGLNSGIDGAFANTGRIFNVEDFHTYWDHPQGDQYWATTGVRQPWQFPTQRLSDRPWICTEWGSLPFGRARGETGLLFAAELQRRGAASVLSFALATGAESMASLKAPIDQFAFHTDPVRLATDRIMVLLHRRPTGSSRSEWRPDAGTYTYDSQQYRINIGGNEPSRRADFLGSLDGEPLSASKMMLLVRFGDAQNTGFSSRLLKDKVVFRVNRKGSTPVRELSVMTPFELSSSQSLRAWSLDPYTGVRKRELPCKRTSKGAWQIRTESINTEIATK